MRNTILLSILMALARAACGQEVVAPTPVDVGAARGQDADDYNIVNTFELGYRFRQASGDIGRYRSDINFGNGLRLFGSNLTVNSRDGHGRYFDQIVLTTLGLGNDPYESATLRLQKNRLYQYDMTWRSDQYYNPGLVISSGEHMLDTRRDLQDHDLVLFPQSKFQLHFGYSHNTQNGPGLTTIQLFNPTGDEFPLFQDVRRQWNQYRLGGDFDFLGFRLTLMRYWEDFKDDTVLQSNGLPQGNNPNDAVTLAQFRRAEPLHGTNPGWLVDLRRENKIWGLNGRFTYVGGQRNFVQNEVASGTDRSGALTNQFLIGGDARRPATTGDFSLSFFPGERLTLVNNTGFRNIRIDGNSLYDQFNNLTGGNSVAYFRFLGIRLITNSTDAQYRFSRWFSLTAGYHYSARHIETVESFSLPDIGPGGRDAYVQDNHLHAGTLGLRISPVRPLTIALDGEVGRADQPFTPLSSRDYHILNGRVQYRARKLTFSAAYRQNYNNNSVTLSSYSSHARSYSANLSWSGRNWLTLDAGYSKLHLDSVAGIAFFAGLPRVTEVTGLDSVYVSNIHAANFGARLAAGRRVELFAGYTITKDVGDGRPAAAPASAGALDALLLPAQTFPLSFQSPLARVSVRLSGKARWNAGWQFYNYHEDFGLLGNRQNYRANTAFTSVLWSF